MLEWQPAHVGMFPNVQKFVRMDISFVQKPVFQNLEWTSYENLEM